MGGVGQGEPAPRLLLWWHLRWREFGRHPSAPRRALLVAATHHNLP
jgi:hypothetical protein